MRNEMLTKLMFYYVCVLLVLVLFVCFHFSSLKETGHRHRVEQERCHCKGMLQSWALSFLDVPALRKPLCNEKEYAIFRKASPPTAKNFVYCLWLNPLHCTKFYGVAQTLSRPRQRKCCSFQAGAGCRWHREGKQQQQGAYMSEGMFQIPDTLVFFSRTS